MAARKKVAIKKATPPPAEATPPEVPGTLDDKRFRANVEYVFGMDVHGGDLRLYLGHVLAGRDLLQEDADKKPEVIKPRVMSRERKSVVRTTQELSQ